MNTYSFQLEKNLKENFIQKTERRFDQLDATNIAKVTSLYSAWGLDVSPLLDRFKAKYDPDTFLTKQIMETNLFPELAIEFSKFDTEETDKMIVKLLDNFITGC